MGELGCEREDRFGLFFGVGGPGGEEGGGGGEGGVGGGRAGLVPG